MASTKRRKGRLIIGVVFILALIVLYFTGMITKGYRAMNNLLKLKDANPKAKALFDKIIEYANNAGYDVTVTGCYYDYDKGVELNRQDSRNPVWSYHTFGLAMDINLKHRETGEILQKASASALWLKSGVPQYAKLLGLRWGGNFTTYYDPIHFDFPVFSIDQLKQIAYDQRKYDTSSLNTLILS